MICKKTVTYAGLKKHVFSSFHAQDIINAIHRHKSRYEAWLKKYEASPATTQAPLILFSDKPNEGYYFCPECNSLRSYRSPKLLTCGHLKETADFIRECLKKDAGVKEDAIVSNAEVELLKKKLEKAELQLKKEREHNAILCEENMAYYSAVSHFHEHDTHSFNTIMSFMKEKEPEFHKKLLKDLDIEEDE